MVGTRVDVKRLELDGLEVTGSDTLLSVRLDGGCILQDRLTCRNNGVLVSMTVNERILVLSDVGRGVDYLHSEVCVNHSP